MLELDPFQSPRQRHVLATRVDFKPTTPFGELATTLLLVDYPLVTCVSSLCRSLRRGLDRPHSGRTLALVLVLVTMMLGIATLLAFSGNISCFVLDLRGQELLIVAFCSMARG